MCNCNFVLWCIWMVVCEQGKGTGLFEQCYYGPQKQYRVTKLSPASKYSFRLAAKNDMGVRCVCARRASCYMRSVGVEVWEYLFSHPSRDFFLSCTWVCVHSVVVSSVNLLTCWPRAASLHLQRARSCSRLGSLGSACSGTGQTAHQKKTISVTYWKWKKRARWEPSTHTVSSQYTHTVITPAMRTSTGEKVPHRHLYYFLCQNPSCLSFL